MNHEDISLLELDHPGANDNAYRARRNSIAKSAIWHNQNQNQPIPLIHYTEEEHATWKQITTLLDKLHRTNASSIYRKAKTQLHITKDHIPELRHLNQQLRSLHNFGVAPIAGLIETEPFLSRLADRTMLCTQYIRHASNPEYTPEPDIVHEVIGHVPMFTNKDLVEFTVLLGRAVRNASPEQIELIARLYWFTIEFGLIEEQGEVKAFGAGLLSSFGEIQHCLGPDVERIPFDLLRIIETPYDFSKMQEQLFILPSFKALKRSVELFLKDQQLI